MATTELTTGTPAPATGAHGELARVARVAGAVWGLTLAAAFIVALTGALAPGGHPHPVLHGTPSEALGLLAHNLRALFAPLILALARWGRGRLTRTAGDVIVIAIVLANTTTVGAALGRFGVTLLPYLPHLPLEWSALTLATCAWVAQRTGPPRPQLVARYGAGTVALAAAAAAVETFAVPHAH